MNYAEFKRQHAISNREIARAIYQSNKDLIQIKKEKTALANLEKIFKSVFAIAFKKGFQSMSMRDLSRTTGISLGALYAYFPSKDKLLSIIQSQGHSIIKTQLDELVEAQDDPLEKLRLAIKAHIYLSEMFRPWFYFIFMEARNISTADLNTVIAMEQDTQNVLRDILALGERQGVINPGDHQLTASMIKSMQQEWYLKRWKYRKLTISVDQYVTHLLAMVAAFCAATPSAKAALTAP